MSFEVTEIKIFPIENPTSKIVANANIVICDTLCIKDIKIINGEKGLFIGMPSVKMKNGEYRDIVYPISKDARKELTEAVLKEFNDDIFAK